MLVDSLSRILAAQRPVTVVLLTDGDHQTVSRPGVDVIRYPLAADGDFLERSRSAAMALQEIVRSGDRIEFHDFEGLGFWALTHRGELGLTETPLTVRFHGPYDMISEVMDRVPQDWAAPSAMEAEVFRMADQVLVPVSGHIPTLTERYGLDRDRLALGPPPLAPLRRVDANPSSRTFAVVGRLGEVKGSHDMVRASIELLEEGMDFSVRFVGPDGWSASASQPMSEWLKSMIPDEHSGSFEFTGPVLREAISEILGDVLAVVVPSRFESFCLAAHEARSAGLPVIVPDIEAFSGILTPETGALVYDPGIPGLTDAMRRSLSSPEFLHQVASRPAPRVGDPLDPYLVDPPPRHRRSQAGLATAATQRVETVTQPAKKEAGILQSIYRFLPEPVARLAARVAPRAMKDRASEKASWPAEQARRAREDRLTAVADGIRNGYFEEIAEPDISVVIPVYNDIRFLDETLASVYEQSHDSWEIIVVDDGSTDPGCLQTLSRLERPRLRLIRQDNTGLPGARNTGMDAARGRFVVPLDSDDELEPTYMSVMMRELEGNPRAAFAHCYARLYHDIDALWMTRPFNPYWQLLENGVVGCVLLRRDAWRDVGGYDETMTDGNEDWELWVRLISRGWEQAQVPTALFKYRKHGVSMSVETEARFETGRRQIRDRHSNVYAPVSLAEFKRNHYPLVTAIVDRRWEPVNEVEMITSTEQLGSTWGKYIVDTRGVDEFPADEISRLAAALEENHKTARASTRANIPLILTRRWNLHDPTAEPSGMLILDDHTRGSGESVPEHVERPLWSPPREFQVSGLPLQRMTPEESGALPNPESW